MFAVKFIFLEWTSFHHYNSLPPFPLKSNYSAPCLATSGDRKQSLFHPTVDNTAYLQFPQLRDGGMDFLFLILFSELMRTCNLGGSWAEDTKWKVYYVSIAIKH